MADDTSTLFQADGVYRLGLCQQQFGAVRRATGADRAGAHGTYARIERARRGARRN